LKNVRVVMSDETFERLKAKAREAGNLGIAAYLLSQVHEQTHDAEVHIIVRRAEMRALNRAPEDGPFLLKKLFKTEDWEKFTKPAKLAAGKEFFARVEAGLIAGIALGEKNSSNHQTYVREE